MGWFTSKPKPKPKGLLREVKTKPGRCPTCGKSALACGGRCWDKSGAKEKERVQVKDRNGRTRTVTRNTGNEIRNGNTWCGSCGCLVRGGRCVNVQCSTRR